MDVRAVMRRAGSLGPARRFKWWAVQGLNLRPLACEVYACVRCDVNLGEPSENGLVMGSLVR